MGIFDNWGQRYREIIEAAAVQFSAAHPKLRFQQSETGVERRGLVFTGATPEWVWSNQFGVSGYYEIAVLDNHIQDYKGIWIVSYLEYGPPPSPSIRPNRGRYVFWNGLTYDPTNETAIQHVVNSLQKALLKCKAKTALSPDDPKVFSI